MKEYKAPNQPTENLPGIFLAGSIEMGKAEDWQKAVSEHLVRYHSDKKYNIFNPRRDNWNVKLKQDISEPEFNEQVTWELEHIEQSDIVFFYLSPSTMSPISLMEIGLCAAKKPKAVIICCPEGFWRRGNVQIMCDRYGMTICNTLEESLKLLTSSL